MPKMYATSPGVSLMLIAVRITRAARAPCSESVTIELDDPNSESKRTQYEPAIIGLNGLSEWSTNSVKERRTHLEQ